MVKPIKVLHLPEENDNVPEVYFCPLCSPSKVLSLKRVHTVLGRKSNYLVYKCQTCGFECESVFLM